jgi:hypothetical protein
MPEAVRISRYANPRYSQCYRCRNNPRKSYSRVFPRSLNPPARNVTYPLKPAPRSRQLRKPVGRRPRKRRSNDPDYYASAGIPISRMNGKRLGSEPENESGQVYRCPAWAQAVDKRDLDYVFHHELQRHEPLSYILHFPTMPTSPCRSANRQNTRSPSARFRSIPLPEALHSESRTGCPRNA